MIYFDSLQAAFDMAGHGVYVWSSYGITAVVIALLISYPMMSLRKQVRQFKEARERELRNARSNHASGS